LQNPNRNGHNYHYVQNSLDAGRHWDEIINQPQCDANYDQRENDVYQRHLLILLTVKMHA